MKIRWPIFYPKPSNHLVSTLTSAKPGQGKGLDAVRTANGIYNSYVRNFKRYPVLRGKNRMILTNIAFKGELKDKLMAGEYYFHWSNPREIRYCMRKSCWRGTQRHPQHDADILVDEMNNIFPADGYKDTPKWLRRLFAQHRHDGIRVYAWTQDYKSVDINYRRMVQVAYTLEKLIGSNDVADTLPPVRLIWGLCVKKKYDPRTLETEGVQNVDKLNKIDETKSIPSSWFLIRKRVTDEYDTQQFLKEYHATLMEEIVMECEHGAACKDPRHRFRITHNPL